MNNTGKSKLLTVPEAARLSRSLSEYTIRKMVKEGAIRSVKSGRRNLIPQEAFEALLRGLTSDDPADELSDKL